MQADVTLTFGQGDDEGMSWDAYIALFCDGAKALFFHERPLMKLDLEAVIFLECHSQTSFTPVDEPVFVCYHALTLTLLCETASNLFSRKPRLLLSHVLGISVTQTEASSVLPSCCIHVTDAQPVPS